MSGLARWEAQVHTLPRRRERSGAFARSRWRIRSPGDVRIDGGESLQNIYRQGGVLSPRRAGSKRRLRNCYDGVAISMCRGDGGSAQWVSSFGSAFAKIHRYAWACSFGGGHCGVDYKNKSACRSGHKRSLISRGKRIRCLCGGCGSRWSCFSLATQCGLRRPRCRLRKQDFGAGMIRITQHASREHGATVKRRELGRVSGMLARLFAGCSAVGGARMSRRWMQTLFQGVASLVRRT
jgi:hypothetical protein